MGDSKQTVDIIQDKINMLEKNLISVFITKARIGKCKVNIQKSVNTFDSLM